MKKNYICPTTEAIVAESLHICTGSKLTWHVDPPTNDSHADGDTPTDDWGFIRFDKGSESNKKDYGYDAWDSDNW